MSDDYEPEESAYSAQQQGKSSQPHSYTGGYRGAVSSVGMNNPYDFDRHKTTNGYDVYNDYDHPEVAMPLSTSAIDAAAAEWAGFIMLDRARRAANARLP